MKKFIALILALCSTLALVACGGGEENKGGPGGTGAVYNVKGANKTQINFHNFNGGVGSVWLEEAAEEFAKIHQETNFGGGSKKGVYIDIAKSMSVDVTGLASSGYHILTTDRFSSPNDVANAGELYCLDDIVADTTREGGALEDVIFDSVKPAIKGNDGSYYGLPHYEYYGGLSYNRNIFNDTKAFFADASDTTAVSYRSKFSDQQYKMTNASGVLSKGPDGKTGTEDDGLPSSMEELLVLMEYFKTRTAYAPVVVSGMHINYSNYFIAGLWAALAGQQQMMNYFNSKGEIQVVTGFKDEPLFKNVSYLKKPEIATVTLDDTNGYLGNDMAAKYYAYALYEIMSREGFWSADAADPTCNHYDAQLALLIGQQAGSRRNAAMLCEATYWYTETKEGNNFGKTELNTGKTEKDFDVRFMNLPNSFYYNATQPEVPSSMINIADSYLFVNKNITRDADVEEAVVEFVKFLYTEKNLRDFSRITGCFRAIEYAPTETDLSSMSSYYANLWKSRKNDGSNVIYCSGDTDGHKLNRGSLKITLDGNQYKTSDTTHVYSGIAKYGAKTLFEMTKIAANEWKTE